MNCKIAGGRMQSLINVFWLMSKKTPAATNVNRKMSLESKSTVISDEVAKFGSWSQQWWDPRGPAKGLHTLNAIRVPFAVNGLLDVDAARNRSRDATLADRKAGPRPLKGFSIADVGCGAGIFSEALARIGADVTGIDAAPELIDVARKHALLTNKSSDNLRYVNTTVESHISDHTGYYDAVVCSEVIEHVDNKEFFVEQCVKLVKSGGSLVFTTINQTWAAWFLMIIGAEYITRMIQKGTHHYHLLMPNEDLEKMLVKNGCHIRSVQGMMIKPNSEWTLINSLSISYLMHAVKK